MKFTSKNKFTRLAIASISTTLLLSGCGGYKTINQQNNEVSYLKFEAPSDQDYTFTINGKDHYKIESCTNKGDIDGNTYCPEKLYEISSGNVDLKIFNREGGLVYDRQLYIGSSSTKKVTIQ